MNKRQVSLLIIIATMILLAGCGKQDRAYPTSVAELNGLRAGCLTGSIIDQIYEEDFSNSEVLYYNSQSDLPEALIANKIDYYMLDTVMVDIAVHEHPELEKIGESQFDQPIGFAARKDKEGDALIKELNDFILNNKEDIQSLQNDWLNEHLFDYESLEKYEPELTGENGTLKVSVCAVSPPFTYADGNSFSGLEIEIIKRFCKERGYKLYMEGTDFGGVIAAVSSGKCDLGLGNITITEERSRTMNFTKPIYHVGIHAVVHKNPNNDRKYYTSANDLDGTRAACAVGMIDDSIISKEYPNTEISYYNNNADIIKAIQSNKVDFGLVDEPTYFAVNLEQSDLTMLTDKALGIQDAGVAFKKGSSDTKLYKQFQEFIHKHKEDGKFDEIKNKWLYNTDAESLEDIEKYNPELDGKNGTITIGVDPSSSPVTYMSSEGIEGIDVEIAKLFAYEYGYDIEWFSADFAGLIPAVSSGKADFAMCFICITEERAEAVEFTDPYISLGLYPLVAKKASSAWSIDGIINSFNRTFIKEDRWKMVGSGLLLTLKITFFATIFGTVLGFLIYLLCRKGNKIANRLFDAFSWLMSGLPMVVILMIAYYIIFGKSEISGSNVAIIAFTISLMLSVYSMLKTAVKSIDKGQTEGALSLGFTDFQAFSRIVLPQSMIQFVPNYMNELINLLKGTAIVGYIAVQDLTKVSDVIRARTYEAFFPLIATALIYLVVVVFITIIVQTLFRRYQPKLRTEDKILKKFKK